MAGDEFDPTRRGDEIEGGAAVLSLRRHRRAQPTPATPQNGAHRQLASRVRVPITATTEPPAELRAPALGWNDPPDVPTHPPASENTSPRPTPPRPARLRRWAVALASVLALAGIGAALINSSHAPVAAGSSRISPDHHRNTSTLLPIHPLAFSGRALAADVNVLRARDTQNARRTAGGREVARKHHARARHARAASSAESVKVGTTAVVTSTQPTETSTTITPTSGDDAPSTSTPSSGTSQTSHPSSSAKASSATATGPPAPGGPPPP